MRIVPPPFHHMKPSLFLSFYDKLESLIQRLPESIKQPVLRELTPIKTLFLLQRPPRIVLLGPAGPGKIEILRFLFQTDVLRPSEANLGDGTWQTFGNKSQGSLQLLDARRPTSLSLTTTSLTASPPDLYLFLQTSPPIKKNIDDDLAHAAQIIAIADSLSTQRGKILGITLPIGHSDPEPTRQNLHQSLHSQPLISERIAGTLSISTPADQSRLAELIAIELPSETQLEIARLSSNRALQKQIAQVVIKSTSAVAAAIGAQPIPLADLPILLSLQTAMVASIMHISGRELSSKAAAEFIASVGAGLGLALVLRETTRAVVKFVPVYGNAVSGAVAAAGTYTIGRSASAYFIENISLTEARQLFRKTKPTISTQTD